MAAAHGLTVIDRHRLQAMSQREAAFYAERNPRSHAFAERARSSLFNGVPMHWMGDWPTPFPLFVERAQGAKFSDVDGHDYLDFCLGDTGAMFGHAPAAVAKALAEQGARGLTTMLPSADAVWVGEDLQRRFGLGHWQVTTTATDANRSVLRWARAITGRQYILVFDGCYHGSVDEAMVRLHESKTVARNGLLGQVQDFSVSTRVVPFNDIPALRAALSAGDVAAVLCEPVMTNIGMVLPDAGFHAELRALTSAHGTLLIIDETHTISTGPGGYTKAFALQPDFFVLGKPVAGGLPCAVYGCTDAVAMRMQQARSAAHAQTQANVALGRSGHGHSGMGTTLSANPLQLACMRATLSELMTEAAYAHMIGLAETLANALNDIIQRRQLPWCVTQIGARVEFQFRATPPRNGREAEAGFDDELEAALHLFLMNRGVLITPFHNMMLICPATTAADVERLLQCFAEAINALTGSATPEQES